jgi:hypothetical protein
LATAQTTWLALFTGQDENGAEGSGIGRNPVLHFLPKMTTTDANWQKR